MNKDIIQEHNRLADKGSFSFWLKMNEFGDMVDI